jgi:hypothetical protein
MLPALSAVARFKDGIRVHANVLSLDLRGITVRLLEPAPASTHTWIRFGLPDGSQSCMALGEVVEHNDDVLRLRFKHIFPDARRALRRALAQSSATPQAQAA